MINPDGGYGDWGCGDPRGRDGRRRRHLLERWLPCHWWVRSPRGPLLRAQARPPETLARARRESTRPMSALDSSA